MSALVPLYVIAETPNPEMVTVSLSGLSDAVLSGLQSLASEWAGIILSPSAARGPEALKTAASDTQDTDNQALWLVGDAACPGQPPIPHSLVASLTAGDTNGFAEDTLSLFIAAIEAAGRYRVYCPDQPDARGESGETSTACPLVMADVTPSCTLLHGPARAKVLRNLEKNQKNTRIALHLSLVRPALHYDADSSGDLHGAIAALSAGLLLAGLHHEAIRLWNAHLYLRDKGVSSAKKARHLPYASYVEPVSYCTMLRERLGRTPERPQSARLALPNQAAPKKRPNLRLV